MRVVTIVKIESWSFTSAEIHVNILDLKIDYNRVSDYNYIENTYDLYVVYTAGINIDYYKPAVEKDRDSVYF
jgi:hypothetical protein